MSFIPSFAVAQLQSNLSIFRATDTSVGSDGAITGRKVYITNAANNYLVPVGNASPVFVAWSIGDISVDINVLTRDLALTIKTDWLDVSGNVLYTVTNEYNFDARNRQFFYYLAQQQTGYPPIVQNTNYFRNAGVFYTNLEGAKYAILFEGSLVNAQPGLDRATLMAQQQSKYF